MSGCALGQYDIAIALSYYRYDDNFDYERVKRLLFGGYSSIKKMLESGEYDLALFIAARRVKFLNYVLMADGNPGNYIETRIKRVQGFIDIYV